MGECNFNYFCWQSNVTLMALASNVFETPLHRTICGQAALGMQSDLVVIFNLVTTRFINQGQLDEKRKGYAMALLPSDQFS